MPPVVSSTFSRRRFLQSAGALGCCAAVAGMPSWAFAAADTDKRLMVVILRGAMDGLAAVAPYGDKSYHDARGGLALGQDSLLPVDNIFAFNTALDPLQKLYMQKELLFMHATATPYRSRSHFDAQDLLENGTPQPHGLTTGWLGRTVTALGKDKESLSIGATVPLLLQGSPHIETWAPSVLQDVNADFMARVLKMYETDPAMQQGLQERSGMTDDDGKGGRQQFAGMMKTAAGLMNTPAGARIGAIDISGWDTHSNQNARLQQAMKALSEGITAFRTGMGENWNNTALLVVTEFGRTVAQNGTKGSDHGTGSVAFLAGGNVAGGRMLGDWPGLAQNNLFEGRDLYPANDMRALLKATLGQHLGIDETILSQTVFPQSAGVQLNTRLFRT